MEKEKLESLIIDYIDNRLNAVERHTIEQELLTNPEARKLYDELKHVISAMEQSTPLTPSSRLAETFQSALQKEIHDTRGTRTFYLRPAIYRVAAAVALIVLGGAIGFLINRNNIRQDQLAEIQKEMEQTRNQLAETKSMLLGMLGNESSASQRLKGVNVAMGLTKTDREITTALFHALYSDPNTNVRLAALDALAKFGADPGVRKELIGSLSKISDPMVQIRLIQLMVTMKETGVVDELQRIVDDESAMKAVKDEAYSGILKLS